jgi:integrase
MCRCGEHPCRCLAFATFAQRILDRREREGVRGIYHERNRFETHIEGASFAAMPIADIRPRDLRAWLREMGEKKAKGTERPISTSTIKRSWSLVSSVFTAAIEDDVIEMNPSSDVRVKKRVDASATVERWSVLTLDEQKAIAACTAIPVTDRLAIRFAIATGLRQGEQFALRLNDLQIGHDDPHVMVRFGGAKDLPPKSGKIRRVILFGDGLIAAKEWLYELPTFAPENPLGLVFPTPHGTRRSCGKPLMRGNALRAHLKHVGITRRVRWHDLRHTFCSNLATGVLGTTWPLLMVKEMAGHSSVTITERYAHVGQKDLVKLGAASSFAHEPAVADTSWTGFDDEAWGVAS